MSPPQFNIAMVQRAISENPNLYNAIVSRIMGEDQLDRRVVDPEINVVVSEIVGVFSDAGYQVGKIKILDGFGLDGGNLISVNVGVGAPVSLLGRTRGVDELYFSLPIQKSPSPKKSFLNDLEEPDKIWACLPDLRDHRNDRDIKLWMKNMEMDGPERTCLGSIRGWIRNNSHGDSYQGETNFRGEYCPVKVR
tara:strand:+ start:3066 stop:3644 length:579 start_codon:yes stop_codon:yes gene_type:complete